MPTLLGMNNKLHSGAKKHPPANDAPGVFEQYFALCGVPDARSQLRMLSQLTGWNEKEVIQWFARRVDIYSTDKARLRLLHRTADAVLHGHALVDKVWAGHLLHAEEMVELRTLAAREAVRPTIAPPHSSSSI